MAIVAFPSFSTQISDWPCVHGLCNDLCHPALLSFLQKDPQGESKYLAAVEPSGANMVPLSFCCQALRLNKAFWTQESSSSDSAKLNGDEQLGSW
jgi:hypothetical protein